MKIEVFGTGCPKCKRTTERISSVIKEKNIQAEIEHIADLNTIVNRGVMITPAVFIDGEKKIEGKIPSPQEIENWLQKGDE